MNLLALDTSSTACSVSISINDKKLSSHSIEPNNHTRSLIPMIEGILNKANAKNPNKKGEDKSHTKDGKLINEKQSKNRARNQPRKSKK